MVNLRAITAALVLRFAALGCFVVNEGGHLESSEAGAEFEYPVHDRPRAVRLSRLGYLFEDSPSLHSTTRTFATSNGTGTVAATASSFADVGSNDGYSR